MDTQTVSNTLYLSALGDGWGYKTEFKRFDQIPRDVSIPSPVVVSDDTQMALAVVQGLMPNDPGSTAELLSIGDIFLRWMDDPDNNRAPGNTCMNALSHFAASREIGNPFTGTITISKGCGANMRAGWLGLLDRPIEDITQLASDQAKITHGHPAALEASALTARAVWAIANHEVFRGQLVEYLLDFADNNEVVEALAKAKNTPDSIVTNHFDDPCSYIGEGWVADEALALPAKIFDVYENPNQALHRAVRTGGDSDSIACIAGSFVGAGLRTDWRNYFPGEVIEFEPRYEHELSVAVAKLS
jgi:ADP-ribosylglycohydrolase